jgi:erythromycin esterase
MQAHVWWYWQEVTDKAPYVRHARALYDLVAALPHPDERYLQHARQIVGFYEQFADPNPFAYRDAHAAKNLRWTQQFRGGRVAYWAAAGHTIDAPQLQLTQPAPHPPVEIASVGSFIRDWYGPRYRTLGFTFDRGAVSPAGQVVPLPPAAPDWLEAPFAPVRAAQFTLDLRERGVRPWLDTPTRTRGIPEAGTASYLSGGTPREWFDLIIHRQVVTPVTPAAPA